MALKIVQQILICTCFSVSIVNVYAQIMFEPPPPIVNVSPPIVNVVTPAMYPLWEGVDVAINNVINNRDAVSLSNVLKELEEMQRRHEVKLPYSYLLSATVSSTWANNKRHKVKAKGTRRLTPQDEKKKKEFESKVARRLAEILSENPQLAYNALSVQQATFDLSSEPQPDQYKDRKGFVDAYASYKVRNADEDIRARYAKKLGGMNEYLREMKREAEMIWKQASKQR